MKINKEQVEVMIETLEELCEELSDNSHGTLFTEQWDLLNYLKGVKSNFLTEAEKIKKELIQQQGNGCVESAHITADSLLCGFLKELGYEDVVEEYEKIKKWYC